MGVAQAAVAGFSYHNVHVTPQPIEAFHHLGLADAPKLAAQHFRKLGLGHAEEFGCFLLRQVPTFDDQGDLVRQLCLDLRFFSISPAQIGVGTAAAFFDGDVVDDGERIHTYSL